MSFVLPNYLMGRWVAPSQVEFEQTDAITGEHIAAVGSSGIDYAAVLEYGRQKGGVALRKMSFQERGRMLKALALMLTELKSRYYEISYRTGATKADSWIDIDGGIGTLFAYASLRRKLPDTSFVLDGDYARLSKEGSFIGHHLLVPRQGIAIHINAFNFPIWGMLEKLAANWLAGMPALVKPSELTSYLTQAVVEDIIQSGILPEGALQLVCGKGHGILDPAGPQDVITFTGSASTGKKLKATPGVLEHSIPFNMEADSLNAAVLGPDVTADSPEFDLFLKEVRREMTAKTGQKCTAIRRVIVPRHLLDAVQEKLSGLLAQTVLGNPRTEGVRMGALASKNQVNRVRAAVETMMAESNMAFGSLTVDQVLGADVEKGAFFSPVLLRCDQPLESKLVHETEAFGPVSTLMPYDELEEAAHLANMGKGSLVSTICTFDDTIAGAYIAEAGAWHGRILILNRESAVESTGHGSPMPLLHHGGPGRAGGGEELGGLRGIKHYLQRVAIQGTPTSIGAVSGVYQPGGKQVQHHQHPFQKHFEDLQIGETHITHKHTVTDADIVNFANLSGDHFYAHVDETALDGTPFEKRVAHGYWVLSKAAGMFVDPRKGPVLLNYGLEECRFTKPVYPGMTIGVKLTVKEKIAQEQRDENDIPKGIVKWLVDVYDNTAETVAIATILTMVRKKQLD